MYYHRENIPNSLQKTLSQLKTGEVISGEAISKNLGISRSAIWKQVKNLRDLGYIITAETNMGYRLDLENLPDRLYPFEVLPTLQTKNLGHNIYWGYDIPSTNDKAKELAREKAAEGTIVLAETQSKGRGRRGRAWESSPSKGIYLSVVLRPQRPLADASVYTFLGAYAVLRLCIEEDLPAQVKWPNDIYVNGKKISGILSELSAIGQDIGYIVLGIGINVNQSDFPEDIPGTSLMIEKGMMLSRKEVLAKLLLFLEEGYERLKNDKHWLIDLMKKYSLLLDKEVVVTGGLELQGVAEDIDNDGALIIRTEEGLVKVWAGDVSVREKIQY